MKKIAVAILMIGMLVLAGSAMACEYPNCGAGSVYYDGTKSLNQTLSGVSSYSWTMTTPAALSVPPDTVNWATLTIYASYVDGNNDMISVQGKAYGALQNESWDWSTWSWEGQDVNITSVFGSWASGDLLHVTLNYNETGRAGSLTLESSELEICYTNGNTPVPEPSTMLLLGFGLAGAAYARKRFKK